MINRHTLMTHALIPVLAVESGNKLAFLKIGKLVINMLPQRSMRTSLVIRMWYFLC